MLERGRLLAQRAAQAELVQRGRAQAVDDPAHVGDRALDAAAARSSSASAASGSLASTRRAASIVEHGAGERRAEPVVQVAAQAAALLLARGDEPLARALDLDGERDGAGGGARAAGEVLEQPPVCGAQRLAVRARAEHQRADALAGVDERQTQRDARGRSAVGGGRLAARPVSSTAT